MTVDREKVRQKLQFMRQGLRELDRFRHMDREQFLSGSLHEAAATRMLQVAIEAMLDLCAHVIAREGWGLPKTYAEAVTIAARHGLVPADMEDTYRSMARFRNRAVHLYDEINAGEVYDIIQQHLDDFRPFMANVISRYLDGAAQNPE